MINFIKSAFSLNLIILYIGRIVSNLGDYVYIVVLSLILAEQNKEYIAILWLIRSLAPFLCGFVAGTVVDRIGHKFSAISSDTIRGTVILLMPLFIEQPIILFLLVFIASSLGSFFGAAFNPIISKVTLHNLSSRHRVNSILSMLLPLAQFIGPFLGTLLLAINQSLPFIAQALSFFISAITLLFIKIEKDSTNKNEGKKLQLKHFRKDLVQSYKYVRNNKVLLSITLTLTIFIFGSTVVDAYEVIFITQGVGLGREQYALIVSIGGIAYFISSIVNTILSKYLSIGNIYFFGLLVSITGNIIFSLSINLSMLIISLIIMAVGVTTLFVSFSTLMQNMVPVEIQGRITSFQSILTTAGATISTAVTGLLISHFSIRFIVVSGAVVMILAILPGVQTFLGLRKTDYIKLNNGAKVNGSS